MDMLAHAGAIEVCSKRTIAIHRTVKTLCDPHERGATTVGPLRATDRRFCCLAQPCGASAMAGVEE